MRNDKRLPDAELEVMQTIWSLGTQVTAAEVQQHADKDWKMTSVLTFLSRLCDKGFLSWHEGGTAKPVHAARQRGGLPSA